MLYFIGSVINLKDLIGPLIDLLLRLMMSIVIKLFLMCILLMA